MPDNNAPPPSPARLFYDEHMRYVARQDIDAMVNATYAEDAVLYHTFPYFPGAAPHVHRGRKEIIAAHRTIFAPENHGAIRAVGDVFNFMEGQPGTNSLFFQVLVRSPTKGLFLNSDFWIFDNGMMKHQFVTGYRLGD